MSLANDKSDAYNESRMDRVIVAMSFACFVGSLGMAQIPEDRGWFKVELLKDEGAAMSAADMTVQ